MITLRFIRYSRSPLSHCCAHNVPILAAIGVNIWALIELFGPHIPCSFLAKQLHSIVVNHNGNVVTAQNCIAFSCHLHRSAKYLCNKLYKQRNIILPPSLITIISIECHLHDIISWMQRDGPIKHLRTSIWSIHDAVIRRSLMTSLNKLNKQKAMFYLN